MLDRFIGKQGVLCLGVIRWRLLIKSEFVQRCLLFSCFDQVRLISIDEAWSIRVAAEPTFDPDIFKSRCVFGCRVFDRSGCG